jgi:hypothetical protein
MYCQTDRRSFSPQNIHANEDEKVQFIVSVKVCSYPNYVCSVWVYFAAVVYRSGASRARSVPRSGERGAGRR